MSKKGIGTHIVCQVGIIVKDIKKTVEAYRDVFGFDEPRMVESGTLEEAHTVYRGEPTKARCKLAFFNVGPQLDIELIEPDEFPSTWREFLDNHGEGVHHIAFTVKDTDKVLAYFEGKGIPTVQKGDYPGGRYAYVDSFPQLKVMIETLENF